MNQRILLSVFLALSAAGCKNAPARDDEPTGTGEMWVGKAIDTALVDQALLAQRTLYPYHFVTESAELNDLGRSDLAVLAAHYAKYAGRLNVRRGDASEQLYAARLAAVIGALGDAGVEGSMVQISDSLPGGDGRTSEQVLVILSKTTPLAPISTTTNSSGQTSGSNTRMD